MRARLAAHAVVILGLLVIAVASVRAGDETCRPIETTWYSPSGVAGCTLDGPTEGRASWYPGDVAAANWCTWPFSGCGSVRVQSHRTGLTITVPVAMYCDCWWTTDRRLVDLTPGQVHALGLDPADGTFAVTVTPIHAPAAAGATTLQPVAPASSGARASGASGPALLPDTAAVAP